MVNNIIYYYEQILMGNLDSFPKELFDDNLQKRIAEKRALQIFKYVIEEYMGWSPEDAATYLDMNFIHKMKLKKPHSMIRFPDELDSETDLVYIVSLLYPEKIVIDSKSKILTVFKKVLSGESIRLPKSFTAEPNGVLNASVCLQYVLEQNYLFNSIEDLYALFITPEASRILKKYRLQNVQKELFVTPLDYLHASLPEDQKNELLYHKYHLKAYEKERKNQQKKASITPR